MPPNLDIYAISKRRDAETIHRFLDTYVDRPASDDRGDEELMLLPVGVDALPKDFEGWNWEPAKTLSHIIQRSLDYPRRAFAVYLKAKDPAFDRIILAFTADNQVVFGISIDPPFEIDQSEFAKELLRALTREFEAHAGFVACEEPPPLITATVPSADNASLLFSWSDPSAPS